MNQQHHHHPIHHHNHHNNNNHNHSHHRIISPAAAAATMMGNVGGIKQLALKAVEAAVSEASSETLLPCLCRVNDVNECILKSSPQKKYGYVSSSGVLHTVEATTAQHHFSTLHLQVFIWIVEAGVNFLTSSFFKALEKQILIVSSSGGDVDLQIQSIRVCWGDESNEIFRVNAHMTLREFIFEFIQRKPSLHFNNNNDVNNNHAQQIAAVAAAGGAPWNVQQQQQPSSAEGTMMEPHTKRILKIIEQAKTINPISSYNNNNIDSSWSSSPASVWSNLLFSEDFSDVKIVCCLDRTTFPAHQCILSGSSPYFKTYFKGPWSKQKGDKQYETRVDSTIFKYILTFMYTGNFGISLAALTTDIVCSILQQGQEFQMARLVDVCCKIIAPRINLDNIKKVTCIASTVVISNNHQPTHKLHLALQRQHLTTTTSNNNINNNVLNNNVNLWKRCAEFIKENSTQVLLHQDFCRLSVENPDLWMELQNEISQSLKRKRKRKRDNRNDISRSSSSDSDDDDDDDNDNDNNNDGVGGNNNNNDNSSEDMSSSDSE